VCHKTGTLPQIRQWHDGSVIPRKLFRLAIPLQISKFRNLGNPTRFGAPDAFLLMSGVCHEWNAKPERSIEFPTSVLWKAFPFFHSGNRLVDARQDSSDLAGRVVEPWAAELS
jgi:hypothetical protein